MALVRFSSVPQMEVAVTNSGSRFFSKANMEFWNSTVETGILYGHYIVTSERMDRTCPKEYTVRYFSQSDVGGRMEDLMLGTFQQFECLPDAMDYLKAHYSDVEGFRPHPTGEELCEEKGHVALLHGNCARCGVKL